MPGQIDTRNLFEQPSGCLEHDQIWKCHHAARGPQRSLIVKFHEMHAHQSQIQHLADNVADLYAISDAYAVFADEEEIADHQNDNPLHRNTTTTGATPPQAAQTPD